MCTENEQSGVNAHDDLADSGPQAPSETEAGSEMTTAEYDEGGDPAAEAVDESADL